MMRFYSNWIPLIIPLIIPLGLVLAEVPRGYSFHISGSGATCEDAKLNALDQAITNTEVSPDPSFANSQVTNRDQAIALCQVRSGQLGFAVTPSDPQFGQGWTPDFTGVGRLNVEASQCSYDPTEEDYHVTNEANGICLSEEERESPPDAE